MGILVIQLLEHNSQSLVSYEIPSTSHRESYVPVPKIYVFSCRRGLDTCLRLGFIASNFRSKSRLQSVFLAVENWLRTFIWKGEKKKKGERWQWKWYNRFKRLKIKVFTEELAGSNLHFPAPRRAHFTPGYRLLKQKHYGAKNWETWKDQEKQQGSVTPLNSYITCLLQVSGCWIIHTSIFFSINEKLIHVWAFVQRKIFFNFFLLFSTLFYICFTFPY